MVISLSVLHSFINLCTSCLSMFKLRILLVATYVVLIIGTSINVTGAVKINHVSTNYIQLHNNEYLQF